MLEAAALGSRGRWRGHAPGLTTGGFDGTKSQIVRQTGWLPTVMATSASVTRLQFIWSLNAK